MAVVAGFNAEGGNRNYQFSSRSTESALHEHLELGWGTRPEKGWFLRAESFYNVATYINDNVSSYFGGRSHRVTPRPPTESPVQADDDDGARP